MKSEVQGSTNVYKSLIQELRSISKLFTFCMLQKKERKAEEVGGLPYFWFPHAEIQLYVYYEQFFAQDSRVKANEVAYMMGGKKLRVGSLFS